MAGVFHQQARPGESELEAVAAAHAPRSLVRPPKTLCTQLAGVPAPRGLAAPRWALRVTGRGSPEVRGHLLCEQKACVTASPGWTFDFDSENWARPVSLHGRQAAKPLAHSGPSGRQGPRAASAGWALRSDAPVCLPRVIKWR